MAVSARHQSDRPARRTALHLWFRSKRRRFGSGAVSSRRTPQWRRRFGPAWWGMVLGATVVLGGIVYLGVTGLMVRGEVSSLQRDLGTVQQFVREGRLDEARHAATLAAPAAARAHSLTSGPVWAAAAAVPWVGSPMASVRDTTTAVDQLANDVLPALAGVAGDLNPATLRPDGSSIDVATLRRIAPMLHTASVQADAVQAALGRAPDHTWLSVVDTAHGTVTGAVSKLAGMLRGADQAAAIAPGLLGVDGTRRYFVGFQNEAEARGTGGLPGAFAILSATDGKVTFERFESDVTLLSYRPDQTVPTGLDFGPDYDARWQGNEPTSFYVNSNLSAHFPYAAQTWVAMWEKVSGEHLDGAIAIDPTALSYLLAVTGPGVLPDGTTVSAEDVVDLTQRVAYDKFPSTPQGNLDRKTWLVSVTEAAERRLLSSDGNPAELVTALARGVGERRILAWSSDPAVQTALARTPAAGIVPDTAAAFSGVVLNNAAAGKLDYYVSRQFDYVRTGCGSTRDVTATMTMTNSAPASGLPATVAGRLDDRAAEAKPGDTRVLFDYMATRGATLQSVTVNGETVPVARFTELGHPIFRVDLELPRGTSVEVVVHLSEPSGGDAPPTFLLPPGITPVATTVNNQTCGG